ncbi:hypothetical protein BU24DRAFT_405109 [Aaosphaeria arxii CBS 175.79]|uniref:Uncharacterized protein n=1 Tax=Aaosphaeria arxii CBS 175.79 TaxID=1450172 RepID=A0A6A5YAH4_9PLEO|nr:uncharacterized protein BU24DRAFT_405109 [Aaosphaeria arxii CBS 175.79]KAF2022223.1 hypothetical protein BU24DRAFT_405109 [Aaosphaeria arxii CBS 175.79]
MKNLVPLLVMLAGCSLPAKAFSSETVGESSYDAIITCESNSSIFPTHTPLLTSSPSKSINVLPRDYGHSPVDRPDPESAEPLRAAIESLILKLLNAFYPLLSATEISSILAATHKNGGLEKGDAVRICGRAIYAAAVSLSDLEIKEVCSHLPAMIHVDYLLGIRGWYKAHYTVDWKPIIDFINVDLANLITTAIDDGPDARNVTANRLNLTYPSNVFEHGYAKLLDTVVRTFYAPLTSREVLVVMHAAITAQTHMTRGELLIEFHRIVFSAAVLLKDEEVPTILPPPLINAVKDLKTRFGGSPPWELVQDFMERTVAEYFRTGMNSLNEGQDSSLQDVNRMQERTSRGDDEETGEGHDEHGDKSNAVPDGNQTAASMEVANDQHFGAKSEFAQSVNQPTAKPIRTLKDVLRDFAACVADDACFLEDEDLTVGLQSNEQRSWLREAQRELEDILLELLGDA